MVQLAIQVDKNEHYPVQSTPKSNIYGEYPKRESKRRCERQLYEKINDPPKWEIPADST